MTARRIGLADLLDSPREIARFREILSSGGVAAIPTDTFYALAADPRNELGVKRVLEIKRRDDGKPLLVLCSSRKDLEELGVAADSRKLDRFLKIWPAPLTVVLPVGRTIPASRGARSLGGRIPASDPVRALIRAVGPLTGTSANRAGAAPLADPGAVAAALGSEIDLLVDGGTTPGGDPSTLLDATREPPVVIRPGAYPWPLHEPETP
ncbi:MAG TPA: L-threonylcarbamoyladenylate synthase [Thermoanaerobaculia bacterium]|nr:L-threonylcarbamoyladenylate synthase [Thermoanaerobaculia bacterium]